MKTPALIRRGITTAALACCFATTSALAQQRSDPPSPRLATGGLLFVERGEHKPPDIVSAAGRYVLTVAMYDRWTGRYVTSLDDAEHSANHIDFAAVGLDIQDLEPVTIGEGDQVVTVFIDPADEQEIDPLRALHQNPALHRQYRVNVVWVPTRGGRSVHWAKKLACSPADTGLEAVLQRNVDALPDAPRPCPGLVTLQKRVATATLIGVTDTPYWVAPDTRIHVGHHDDLAAWLGDHHRD